MCVTEGRPAGSGLLSAARSSTLVPPSGDEREADQRPGYRKRETDGFEHSARVRERGHEPHDQACGSCEHEPGKGLTPCRGKLHRLAECERPVVGEGLREKVAAIVSPGPQHAGVP